MVVDNGIIGGYSGVAWLRARSVKRSVSSEPWARPARGWLGGNQSDLAVKSDDVSAGYSKTDGYRLHCDVCYRGSGPLCRSRHARCRWPGIEAWPNARWSDGGILDAARDISIRE